MFKKEYLPKDIPFNLEAMSDEMKWGSYGAHDPAIIKEGKMYYVFSTDTGSKGDFKAGIQIRQSSDLIHWTFVGRAFTDGVPKEAKEWTDAKGLWAPEVVKMNGRYYMYYSASQFGKTQSFIGVAVSEVVTGPYEDLGLVYRSKEGTSGPNAIDPNITVTPEGRIYMVFGSFFGGIYVNEINPETGKFKVYGEGKLIARRHRSVDRALEGPYIVYNPTYSDYYLFVSYDSLFSDYNIRVGRSKSITGPYLDYNGKDLTDLEGNQDEIGMKVLGSYKFEESDGWLAPGHNSVLKDGENYFVCHHMREPINKHVHYVQIRKILWTDEGWPLVSPERYAGEDNREIDQDDLKGTWELITLDPNNHEQDISRHVVMTEAKDFPYFESKQAKNSVKLHLCDGVLEGKVNVGWDWERWCETIVFAGYNDHGLVTFGKKCDQPIKVVL